MSLKHMRTLRGQYCAETWEDPDDIKFKGNNFNNWLSHRYENKKVRIWDKVQKWYKINKTKHELEHMPEGRLDYPTAKELGGSDYLPGDEWIFGN
jgi:hypothetical protein